MKQILTDLRQNLEGVLAEDYRASNYVKANEVWRVYGITVLCPVSSIGNAVIYYVDSESGRRPIGEADPSSAQYPASWQGEIFLVERERIVVYVQSLPVDEACFLHVWGLKYTLDDFRNIGM